MSEEKELPSGWSSAPLELLLDYVQPQPYIVVSTEYCDKYTIPVLTPGKTFVLGKTNETKGVYRDLPVIIFDDFTTAIKFVNFPFKVKSSAMKILKPSSNSVCIGYVFYYMNTLRITADTHKRYWISTYSKIAIPLPPLPEQRRIVAKIEELFSSLDKGIERLKEAQAQLKIYRQAVLKWAFEGKLTESWRKQNNLPSSLDILDEIKNSKDSYCKTQKKNNKEKLFFTQEDLQNFPELSKGWVWVKIDALAENEKNSVKAGPFGSSLKKETYVNHGYKIYGQEQVISGNASYGDYYIDRMKYLELSSCCVKPFDILISLVGTIGKVLILPENSKAGIINPRLIKISLNRDLYLPAFFKYFFESTFLKQLYRQKAHGATMDVLNLEIIRSLPFPLCSRIEQEKVIQEIESRLSVCDKLEESIRQSLLQAESLRQSILKKAFEGKLVPQDPNDEPASVLLERIRSERNAGVPEKKTRKTKEAK